MSYIYTYVVDVSLQLYASEFLTLEVGIMYGPDGQLRKGNVPWTEEIVLSMVLSYQLVWHLSKFSENFQGELYLIGLNGFNVLCL